MPELAGVRRALPSPGRLLYVHPPFAMPTFARRHPRPARPKFRRARATLVLLALCWLSYFLFLVLPDGLSRSMQRSLALSAGGLERGFYWEIITHLFIHHSFLHLLVNSILLYFAGRALERVVGSRRFLIVFFVGGLFGGAAEYLRAIATPQDPLIMGNSAAVCAVILAIATLRPRSEAILLLFFVIPLKIRVAIFGGLILVSSLVLAIFDSSSSIGYLGHFAGALSGLLLGFLMRTSRGQEVLSREERMQRHHREEADNASADRPEVAPESPLDQTHS